MIEVKNKVTSTSSFPIIYYSNKHRINADNSNAKGLNSEWTITAMNKFVITFQIKLLLKITCSKFILTNYYFSQQRSFIKEDYRRKYILTIA